MSRARPDAWSKMSAAVEPIVMDRMARLGLSPRQQHLNRLWAVYTCAQYDVCAVDWDGSPRPDPQAKEVIATAGFISPGFFDASLQMQSLDLPLKYRRPSTPYHLCKVVVDRFTGLLFSERRHPKLDVTGDPLTEDWVNAFAEEARLWPAMIQARKYGGACGSVAVGFTFADGVPRVEVHDPRWTMPDFADRSTLRLRSIDKRYMYPAEERDPETGGWVTVWYWYRRVIDEQTDTTYLPAPVGRGDEPDWDSLVGEQVVHGYGFCPVVWIQNQPVDDDVDGEPDCHGITDLSAAIDRLLSQADLGTSSNSDPTVVLEGVGDTEIPALRKGSRSAIKLPVGTAKYLELSGSGPASALTLGKELRALALEVAQCVLDHPDVAGRTATEIERVYSSMLGKADVLREQYGQRGVLVLADMAVRAARSLGAARVDAETGKIVRYAVSLPPRIDEETGRAVQRTLGPPGSRVAISWPGYFDPGLADAQAAAGAAATAVGARLIDAENATKFVSTYFRIDDVAASMQRMEEERAREAASLESDLLGANAGPPEPAQPKPDDGLPSVADMPPEAQVALASPPQGGIPLGTRIFQFEIDSGIFTINEIRSAKGVGPIPDGHLTVPAYRAKYAEIFAKAAGTESADVGGALLEKELDLAGEAPSPSVGPPAPFPGGPKPDRT